MKTELIEHHLTAIRSLKEWCPPPQDEPPVSTQIAFHERAVAWLESLDVEEQHESERALS